MLEAAEKLITKPRFALFWSPEYRRAAADMEKAATKFQVKLGGNAAAWRSYLVVSSATEDAPR